MHKTLPWLLAIFFAGCTNKINNNRFLFVSLNQGLEKSNALIDSINKRAYEKMHADLYNPVEVCYTSRWYPDAMHVKTYTGRVIGFIDSLKTRLKKEAGFNQSGKGHETMDNSSASEIIFIEGNMQVELKRRITVYKDAVLAINSDVMQDLKYEIDSLVGFSGTKMEQDDYWDLLFKDKPVIEVLTVLNKLENDIRYIENKWISCIYMHNCHVDGGHEREVPIVQQNSNVFKPGDELEINAGVGFFSRASAPQISINGKNVALDDSYMAVSKIKVPLQPGEYSVPVKIEYYTPAGTRSMVSKTIKYTVFEAINH